MTDLHQFILSRMHRDRMRPKCQPKANVIYDLHCPKCQNVETKPLVKTNSVAFCPKCKITFKCLKISNDGVCLTNNT
jgi:uncharacterized paraquat-inducible protein A